MGSAFLWACAVFGFVSELAILIRQRAEPGVPAAPPADYEFGTADTCPATCPPPSLAFCVWGPLDEYALYVAALLPEPVWLATVVGCSAVSLGLGILIGRSLPAPRPQLERPHGRRPGVAERRGRA